jgi:transcriptional regulator with XRE-family HTH domain
MTFSQKIRNRRQRARITQAELGLACSRTQTWVCGVERGHIPIGAEIFTALVTAIDRLEKRKHAIESARQAATEKVVRDFENPKIPADGCR